MSESSLAVVSRVLDSVVARGAHVAPEELHQLLHAQNLVLGETEAQDVFDQVNIQLSGYGKLQSLFQPGVTDILVNHPDSVWWDSGDGLKLAPVRFESDSEVRQLAVRLAISAGRRLDDSLPSVDATLPDGVRLHAVLPPISPRGTSISLRIPAATPLTLEQWFDPARGCDPALRDSISDLIATKATCVISGATGSGKTTLLRSLIAASPPRRWLIVEEMSELNIELPHVVSLQGRLPNVEGKGEIGLDFLVRQTLRMRPDSVVVGEIRGSEVVQWLLAVSSGHGGSLTTVHADSAHDAVSRLALLASMTHVPLDVMREIVLSSVDAVIHCDRKFGWRRIAEIKRLK